MVVIKHQQKLVYELYEYLEQIIMIKDKKACLLGGIPFTVKIIHSTISLLQETVYRNDSMLFNLHEFCFTNINYDL